MRLPRDLSGAELVNVLRKFGYEISRQVGSHIRLTTLENGVHHITIPNHPALRIGLLPQFLMTSPHIIKSAEMSYYCG